MIYGEGKSLEQIQGIVLNMKKNEVENILLTRVSSETGFVNYILLADDMLPVESK